MAQWIEVKVRYEKLTETVIVDKSKPKDDDD